MTAQLALFSGFGETKEGVFGDLPEGLVYRPGIVTAEEEEALAAKLADLPFEAFQFHGFEGNRRTVSFGWHYAFDGSGLKASEPIPDWLLPFRARAASLAEVDPEALGHLLVIEYAPGAGIGWHKDRPVFGDVVGLSLMAPAKLRFRRKLAGSGGARQKAQWERKSVEVEPRSGYLLRGAARSEWEHSILPMEVLRYSLTFRTLLEDTRVPGGRRPQSNGE
jgi:alkylated DNA repair protein (DNA oxidative demethylase)